MLGICTSSAVVSATDDRGFHEFVSSAPAAGPARSVAENNTGVVRMSDRLRNTSYFHCLRDASTTRHDDLQSDQQEIACSAAARDAARASSPPVANAIDLRPPGRAGSSLNLALPESRRIIGLEGDGVVLLHASSEAVGRSSRSPLGMLAAGGLRGLRLGSPGRDRPGPRQLVVRVGVRAPRVLAPSRVSFSIPLSLKRLRASSRRAARSPLWTCSCTSRSSNDRLSSLSLATSVLSCSFSNWRWLIVVFIWPARGPAGQDATASRAPCHHHKTP